MVLTRSNDTHKVSLHQPKDHDQHVRRSMSRRSQDLPSSSARGSSQATDVEVFSTMRKRTRSASRNELNIRGLQNGNSEDAFLSRQFDSEASTRNSASRNLKSALRHSSIDADISIIKKRESVSHSRSLRSLGLEEEGSSCEEDDGIGALASTIRPRSSSRETFPNMLLRRSSREKKTLYSTLNMSTLEHAVIMDEDLNHESPRKRKKARSIKPELRDLLIGQGKNPEELESLSQPDIYSSIKSRKRLRRPRRFFDEENPVHSTQLESDHSDQEQEEEEEKEENHDENAEDEEQDTGKKYSLRTKRAQPLRLVYEIQRQTRQAPRSMFDHLPASPAHRRRNKLSNNPASPYQQRQRRTNSQGASSTSSSDSDSDERKFQKRKKKSMAKARNRCLPMNLTMNDLASHGFASDRRKIGSSLADVDPMNVDKTVKFSSIGGHKKHVQSLKEMVVFPLLYPEVFQKFHINPPRGCLFYGPPGNGKTLMARALANECSSEGKKVAFFMRKGADCLSKWVGESERQLRLLFDQAYQMRPSIIFFDEIDGLAPVRSSRQDQIHSSIVSTLLGLMDGLDNRGEIIVIGATNRIDSIDPALRRPGRFDREFAFPPPDKETRYEILKIHTQKWSPPLSEAFLNDLAERTTGYCGADIMTLCAESALFALRRRYPQIYASDQKLKLNVDSISIQASDFYKAMKAIVPSSQRSNPSPAYALNNVIRPLFLNSLKNIMRQLADQCPLIRKKSKMLKSSFSLASSETRVQRSLVQEDSESEFEDDAAAATIPLPVNGLTIPQSLMSSSNSNSYRGSTVHRPRLLIRGERLDGITTHLAPALLYDLEGMPVHLLDIPALYGFSVRTPEEACAQVFREARRTAPSIIYMPNIAKWWESASTTVRHTFDSLLRNLPASSPVMLIATAECLNDEFWEDLLDFFRDDSESFTMNSPTNEERLAFFAPIFLQLAKKKPVNKQRKRIEDMEVLDKAPPPDVAKLTRQELEKIELAEESTMRSLRLFLRDVLTRLAQDRRFKAFLKPVDIEEVPDYVEVIANPMDISTMMNKIDQHQYNNVAQFIEDINLICSNALEYNPDHCAEDRAIRHRACLLKDIALAIIEDDLDPDFEKRCNEVIEARKRRKANPLKFAPRYYKVLPKPSQLLQPIQSTANDKGIALDSSLNSKTGNLPIKSPGASTRKRRRRSAWALGRIKKPKRIERKSRANDEKASTNDEDEEEKAESEDQQEERSKENEEDNKEEGVESDEKIDEATHINPDSILTEQNVTITTEDDNQSQTDLFENSDIAAEVSNQSLDSSNTSLPESSIIPTQDTKTPVSTSDQEQENVTCTIKKLCDTNENSFKAVEKEQTMVTSTPQDDEDEIMHDPLEDDLVNTDATATLNKSKEIEDDKEEQPQISPLPIARMTLRSRRSHKEDEPVSAPLLPPPPPLLVDEEELKDILRYTVKATSDFRVERLERLYSILARCVYKHRHNYDKTLLTQDLEKEVCRVTGIQRFSDDSV